MLLLISSLIVTVPIVSDYGKHQFAVFNGSHGNLCPMHWSALKGFHLWQPPRNFLGSLLINAAQVSKMRQTTGVQVARATAVATTTLSQKLLLFHVLQFLPLSSLSFSCPPSSLLWGEGCPKAFWENPLTVPGTPLLSAHAACVAQCLITLWVWVWVCVCACVIET